MDLGLDRWDAVIFDLDGVVTRTACLHAAAWKAVFDEFLATHDGVDRPFDADTDYRLYVDGKPRYEGVRSFLESRHIRLPFGAPSDPPERDTMCGLGNRKNQRFQRLLEEVGVEVYPTSIDLLGELRAIGVRTAVVSSSKSCEAVVRAAGIERLFDARVDGVESARLGLAGKPAPDTFLEAARRLGVDPRRAVVIEDAIAGVEAGRRGGFGCVIGVDRVGQPEMLVRAGADVVVSDLGEIRIDGSGRPSTTARAESLPSAWQQRDAIARRIHGKRLAAFFDYDGTLTPIVARPELAVLSPSMRRVLVRLSRKCTVAIVSGRDLGDLVARVGIEHIAYAGSHGLEIAGPAGSSLGASRGEALIPALRDAEQEIRRRLAQVPGVVIEPKRLSLAVHYRLVSPERRDEVRAAVDQAIAARKGLRRADGKRVFDVRPDIDWDKGRALTFLRARLGLAGPGVVPLYIGDDLTDEDAFAALPPDGIGIVVRGEPRDTLARFALDDPTDVERFLTFLADSLEAHSDERLGPGA